jgi:hypothetical protein
MKVIIDEIFKSGDRVYHYIYGWGTIIGMGNYIDFDNQVILVKNVFEERRFLSFTFYTLDGFSQERPEELPKKGQIVWGSNHKSGWCICYFLEKVIDGGYKCTVYNPFIPNPSYTHWNYITTEYPYKDE